MPEVIELPENNLFNVFNILLLENKHRLVKQLKECYEPNVHGHKTWASSFLLMDYFQTHRVIKSTSQVLELGCGWGAASIYCAKNGAKEVTGLDIDENVFPYLKTQAALNGVDVKCKTKSYDKLTAKQLDHYNLIMGGDICFWDELAQMLEKMIRRALKSGVKRIVLADPGRSPFLELAERCTEFAKASLTEWYVCDPDYYEGFILDIKPKKTKS
ncbi:class I SAM-dependent methyltransferase [Pleionea sediminis]|uniref:class I SAM-dependent methyltransferase n=1 Tax=Pleionea sediminis TaxID=2569479 RepID=UPI001184AD0A|nr:methyltransferase domain-containing protein [Pleionea sediminis]